LLKRGKNINFFVGEEQKYTFILVFLLEVMIAPLTAFLGLMLLKPRYVKINFKLK